MTPEQIQEIILAEWQKETNPNIWTTSAARKILEQIELEESKENREAVEILRYAGCLDNVDDDVAELAVTLIKNEPISMAELTIGLQKIKNSLSQPSQKISSNRAAVSGRPAERGDAGELKTESNSQSEALVSTPKDAPRKGFEQFYCEEGLPKESDER